jgi:hypothetical protein
MGGSTETTKTVNQATGKSPWGPSQGLLSGILGKLGDVDTDLTGIESGALGGLLGNAGYLGRFGPQVSAYANELLGGGTDRTGSVNDAYARYQQQLAPTAVGDYLDPNKNPFFAGTTSAIADDVLSRIKNEYAGAGRDPTGAGSFVGKVGEAVSKAVAPIYADVYNRERGRQLDAVGGLYGAGGQTAGLLSNLDQVALANKDRGIEAARMAQSFANDPHMHALAVEAQRRGIPLQTLAQISGIGLPIGSAFGTSTSTGTETTQKEQPFNPWSLAPLAILAPGFIPGAGGGMSLGGNLLGGLGGGLFGGLSNDFLGGGNWLRF